MKLTTTTMVTVDGVMQDSAGRMRTAAADSSAAGVAPLFDNEAGTFLNQVYERADALLRTAPTGGEGGEERVALGADLNAAAVPVGSCGRSSERPMVRLR